MDLKPFEGATNRTVVGVFAKGHSVRYPVSYPYWKKRVSGRGGSIGFDTPYEEVTTQKVTFRTGHGEPVDGNDRTSSWITARRSALNALHNVLGGSSYEGREGVNTGGANGVFWVDITGQRPGGIVIVSNVLENVKKKVAQTQAAVEGELVFPLLRGSDVSRWSAAPSQSIILTHRLGERLKAISNALDIAGACALMA